MLQMLLILHERPHVFQQEETLQTVMAGPSGTGHTKYRFACFIRNNNKSQYCRLRHRKRRRKYVSQLLHVNGLRFNTKYFRCRCHQQQCKCGRSGTDPISNVFSFNATTKRKTIRSAEDSGRRQLRAIDGRMHRFKHKHNDVNNQWQQWNKQLLLQSSYSQFGLYFGAKRDDTRPTGTSDCLQIVAVAGPEQCQGTETKSIVSKPQRSHLQLLQSRTLESIDRKR